MMLNRLKYNESVQEFLRRLRHLDYFLIFIVFALCVFGILMIHSATNTGWTPANANMHRSQILFIVSGAGLMFAFAFIDYRLITNLYILIYGGCILLLLIVLFIGASPGTANTARWLYIPLPGFGYTSLQPSEIAKIAMILSLSKFLEVKKDKFNHIFMLLFIAACIAFPVYLIQRQPSLSASVVILVSSLIVLFIGGLYYRTIFIGLALIVPVLVVVWMDLRRANSIIVSRILGYQWQRIETFLRPIEGSDEFRQVQQSLYSISSGGLFGKGYGNNGHVIHSHNDFIFSIISEQFGFVGGAIVLGVLAMLIIKCIHIALRADDLNGRLIAGGIAGMIMFETFVNVGVVTALLPNTGMTLPFLSYGGTSIWVHMIAIGIVLNIGIPRIKPMFSPDWGDTNNKRGGEPGWQKNLNL